MANESRKQAAVVREDTAHTLEIIVSPREIEWTLEISDDSGGRRIPFVPTKGLTTIGSSSRADVCIKDPTVSSVHCEISRLGSGLLVRDLDSKNGTFVASARVTEAWCSGWSTITIGRTTLICWPERRAEVSNVEDDGPPLPGLMGRSMAMRKIAREVRKLATLRAPVLVAGESGTGKELVARALHAEGPRKRAPFIALNVAALPRELIESELFGYERGAFTGASSRRAGAFEQAEGGTLFLDEIGEMPLEAQPKLLRALDGYDVQTLGSVGPRRLPDVRVVAATHRPLEELVTEGRFRLDLFHRLEVFVIETPPLRERRGDISPISKGILEKLESELGPRSLTTDAIARLTSHTWPGNVRELRNVLYRAAALATEGAMDANLIELAMRRRETPIRPPRPELSPRLARALLEEMDGNLSRAARTANIPRTTFRKLAGLRQKPSE